MIINHNLSAMFSYRNQRVNSWAVDKDREKLASGLRIARAGDDAAGLAISEKMRSQIRGLNQGERNTQDGISFIQTTEGYLEETTSILQRMRVLAVQSSTGTNTPEDRIMIQIEVSQLVDEVNRIASQAQFNGMNMLTGRFARPTGANTVAASMWIHIGANMDQREQVFIGTMNAQGLGLQGVGGLPHTATFFTLSDPDRANTAIGMLDTALGIVNKQRADLGAYQNRLEHASKGLMVAAENLQASESRIRDTDMASQMVDYVKNQILVQSSTAMLAQANQRAQSVLQLFQ